VNDLSSAPETWLDGALRALVLARRLHAIVESQAQAYQLSESAAGLLWACESAPPEGLDQQELAQRLAVSPAQVSAQVERLARRGLLQCRAADGDRRRRLWEITPAGATVLSGIRESCRRLARQRGAA
jgi:DNA-binding MarR family transcriptional regulator